MLPGLTMRLTIALISIYSHLPRFLATYFPPPSTLPLHNSAMHIREATIDDIPRLTELWLAACGTHSAFDTLFPCRIEAPEDFRLMIAEDILDSFLQGEERYLVVETETEQRQVVAWASWTRMGSSDVAAKIRAQSDSVMKGASPFLPWGRRLTLLSVSSTRETAPRA